MILPVEYDKGGYRTYGTPWGNMFHNGHDYNVNLSESVRAITSGKVIFSNMVDGFGSLNPDKPGPVIVIEHIEKTTGCKFSCIYGHVQPAIKLNEEVSEGQIIGNVIAFYNGDLLLPHLHFAIYKKNGLPPYPWGYVNNLTNWIDPVDFFKKYTRG